MDVRRVELLRRLWLLNPPPLVERSQEYVLLRHADEQHRERLSELDAMIERCELCGAWLMQPQSGPARKALHSRRRPKMHRCPR